ncbi:hypothetical protein FB451DRAFT_1553242 [Mycena latifolia]|nr:hypothetical protein FB451DRAFT_1553242 [Mycena latifolia]
MNSRSRLRPPRPQPYVLMPPLLELYKRKRVDSIPPASAANHSKHVRSILADDSQETHHHTPESEMELGRLPPSKRRKLQIGGIQDAPQPESDSMSHFDVQSDFPELSSESESDLASSGTPDDSSDACSEYLPSRMVSPNTSSSEDDVEDADSVCIRSRVSSPANVGSQRNVRARIVYSVSADGSEEYDELETDGESAGESYKSNSSLNKTKPEEHRFECIHPTCKEDFTREADMKRHFEGHDLNATRPCCPRTACPGIIDNSKKTTHAEVRQTLNERKKTIARRASSVQPDATQVLKSEELSLVSSLCVPMHLGIDCTFSPSLPTNLSPPHPNFKFLDQILPDNSILPPLSTLRAPLSIGVAPSTCALYVGDPFAC